MGMSNLPLPLRRESLIGDESSSTRLYSEMAPPDQVKQWLEIFRQFDRDGGGDVDLRELGLMFRHLGQTPTEAQMMLFIEEVDIDKSGTVDFEEFCLLMMRQSRLTQTPLWLYQMLHPPFFSTAPPADLPTVATLNDGKHDAAMRIRRHMGRNRGDEGGPTADSIGLRPAEFTSFTRNLLLSVVDLLPSAEHIRVAQMSGHGSTFGPFVVEELLWRLVTSTRTNLEQLELANNDLGDDGAIAVSRALMKLSRLVSVDLSSNNITQRGASAIYEALCNLPPGSRLSSVRLDDNFGIAPGLLASIHTQALSNNLAAIVGACRDAPPPPPPEKEEEYGAGSHPLEQNIEGMPLPAAPLVALREQWLSHVHMASLRTQLSAVSAGRPPLCAFKLFDCPRLSDPALAVLLAAPATAPVAPTAQLAHSYLSSLKWLRISNCHAADSTARALAEAVENDHLRNLVGLALDHNHLTLAGAVADDGNKVEQCPLAVQLGTALRALPKLEELDLCHNEKLGDGACAAMCAHLLLAPVDPPADAVSPSGKDASPGGMRSGKKGAATSQPTVQSPAVRASAEPPSLRILHLGNTGAGNATASSIANTLPTSRLQALCLSGEVGDQGATSLAAVLPQSTTLRELWLGNKIGDTGLGHIAQALAAPETPLKLLGLGGTVRGGVVVSNRLESRAPSLLAEALRAQPEGVNELRLSGNGRIGGAGVSLLIRALSSCTALRELHVDGCGVTAANAGAIVDAMNEVWCLHVLVLESSGGGAAAGVSGAGRGAWGRKKVTAVPVLTMTQRLGLAKLLEDNRRMGRRRVDSWRLSRSLDEVAWVFTTMCAGLEPEVIKGDLRNWDGKACARLVTNLGLPQYAESVAFNLTGASLPSLQMTQLAQLGITAHDDQKTVMKAVRSLLHAYERRQAVAKAQASWNLILNARNTPQQGAEALDVTDGDGPSALVAPDVSGFGNSPRRGSDLGGRRPHRSPRRRARAAGGAPQVSGGPLPATPSQRPDPSVAIALSDATSRVGSVRLPPVKGAHDGSAAASPRRGDSVAQGRATAGTLPSLSSAVGPMAVPASVVLDPDGFNTGARLQVAAESVGQPTSERDGAGVLPVGAWLVSPRSVVNRSQQHGVPLAFHSPRAMRPDVQTTRYNKLARNDELSRRILASLSAGGKLPDEAQHDKRPAFHVATNNEYAGVELIRRRLGVGTGT